MNRSIAVRTAACAGALIALLPLSAAAAHVPSSFSAERLHIEQRARSQVGALYRSGGTSPGGFDCSGFTRWVYAGHGANLPHSSAAQFDLAGRKGYQRVWNRQNLERGDLVFFRTTSAQVGHVGIYLANGRFISSTTSSGVRVDSVYDSYYWGSRWVGATRLPATARWAPPNSGHGAHREQLI